jgi:hypothetical protein
MFEKDPEFAELMEKLHETIEAEATKRSAVVYGILESFGLTEDRLQQIVTFAGLARMGIAIKDEEEGSGIVVTLALIHLDEAVHRSWQISAKDEPRDLSDEVLDEAWTQMKPRWRDIDKLLEAANGIMRMHDSAKARSFLN